MKKAIFVFIIMISFSLVSNAHAWRGHKTHHGKRGYGTLKIYINKHHRHQHHFRNYSYPSNGRAQGYIHKYKHRPHRYRLHYHKKRGHRYYRKYRSPYGYPNPQYRPYAYGSDNQDNYFKQSNTVVIEPKRPPIKPSQSKPESLNKLENLQNHERPISKVWIPPKKEKTWVPGSWSYGIRKTWRGDHWHFETNPNDKKWVEGYFETRVIEPGYFKIIR